MSSILPPRMRGADGSNAGAAGLVPKPTAADNVKLLHGDGTWKAVTNASAATDAQANAAASTTTFTTPANAALAAMRIANTKSPRPGVAFDGTSSQRAYATLTNQNIGTDPFSISVTLRVPTSNPASGAHGIVCLSPNATGGWDLGAIDLLLDTTGVLSVNLYDAANVSNRHSLSGPNLVSGYAGKVVTIALVRNASGDPALYINGVAQTFTAGTSGTGATGGWQAPVTSTYLVMGTRTSSAGYQLVGSIHSATLYNLALSAADVLEIAESGGAVPFRYQYGSQTGLLTGDDVTFASAGNWSPNAPATISGGKLNLLGTHASNPLSLASQKAYRLTATIDSITAGEFQWYNGSGYVQVATTTGTKTYEMVMAATTTLFIKALGGDAVVDNVQVTRIGAICHFACDEGIGYQLHDASTNKLDAVMTTTGVHHLVPKREGYVRQTHTWAAANDAKYLGATQRILPNGALLTDIVLHPTASTSGTGATLSSALTLHRWMAGTVLTANTRKLATIANRIPAGTADNDHTMYLTPDSTAYTGSITAEVRFAVTEGSP